MASNPEHYAIVIGIDGYTHFPSLKAAVNDATRFTAWLVSEEGGGLSPENVKLILSPPELPSNPLDALPAQYNIDNALYEIGVKKGEFIGQRLYFYFAGHAVESDLDDVAMLMAPASMDRLGHNIGLGAYRQFFRETGLFDEVIFILDCSRDKVSTPVKGSEPSFTLPKESKINVNEFVLLAAATGARAFQAVDSDSNKISGLLTQAMLDGLEGEAADNSGQITSTSLSAYVQRRVPELANTASLQQIPTFILPTREIVLAEDKFNEAGTSTIIVEVPHWSASVTIYDNSMKPVLSLNQAEEESPSSGKYFVTGKLLKGIYLIEVTLEGKSQKELRVVSPAQLTLIPRSTWKTLKFVSPIPLHGQEKRLKLQAEMAVEHSLKPTWQKSPGSNFSSRLFLFVRTSEPKRYPLFHMGLSLKRLNEETDSTGNIKYSEETITEFTDDAVEIDKDNGWMAFCADLEPGFYILQKHRPPHFNRPRQQPIYLCAGWETQVFMNARNSPSLGKLSLSMASLGAGFDPNDETAEAAEAVLDAIRHDIVSSKQLVTGEKIRSLLKSERRNPWLGILAAYALRPQLSEYPEGEDLFNEIITFLQSTIGEHPDVRALTLKTLPTEATALEETEIVVFKEPPLLRAGFKIVREYALKIAKTIPLGSLTERLLDKVLTDTPWTAWRELDFTQLFEESVLRPQTITPTLIEAESYLQSVSPKAPVIRLSNCETVLETPPQDAASDAPSSEPLPVSSVNTQDACLIKAAMDLTHTGDLDELPETYTLNSNRFAELLDNVKAEEVSAASGVPLARTEEGLQSLREKHKTQATGGFTEEILQTPVENLVLGYALKKSSQAGETAETVSLTESLDMPQGDSEVMIPKDISTEAQAESAATLITIEECVAKIKAEAARLISPQIITGESKTKVIKASDNQYRKNALAIAQHLQCVADYLLAAAAFTAMTDIHGQVTHGNGAFIELVSTRNLSLSEDEQKRKCEAHKQLLGEALNAAPLGNSMLSNPIPVPESIYREFKLHRTEIKNGDTQFVQAYLNVLRVKDAASINIKTLQDIDSGLPELRLYASLFAHGTSESRKEYYKKLVELVKKFQQITMESGEINNINIDNSIQEDAIRKNILNNLTFDARHEAELSQPDGSLYEREFWGISRHELIAGAAMELLSNRARLEVRRILAPIDVIGLEDVAGWADYLKQGIANPDSETTAFQNDNRNRQHGTWHYVNIPHGATGYNREDYPQFTRDDDVVQMIRHSVLVLKGESDRFSELNALRWLTHLVGDVHQPIHVGCGYIDESSDPPLLVSDPEIITENHLEHDRGGNQIQLPNVGASLHSYWDSRILSDTDDNHDENEADAPADESNVTQELKARFIQKLVDRINKHSQTENNVAADESIEVDASENPPEVWSQAWAEANLNGVPLEDWAQVWATVSVRLAREAYQSLRITRKQGTKFKVDWEGRTDYDRRCQPLAQWQANAATKNLAALLNAIWPED